MLLIEKNCVLCPSRNLILAEMNDIHNMQTPYEKAIEQDESTDIKWGIIVRPFAPEVHIYVDACCEGDTELGLNGGKFGRTTWTVPAWMDRPSPGNPAEELICIPTHFIFTDVDDSKDFHMVCWLDCSIDSDGVMDFEAFITNQFWSGNRFVGMNALRGLHFTLFRKGFPADDLTRNAGK